jgi:hypothetical protein
MKIVLNDLEDFLEEIKVVVEEDDTPVVRYLVDVSAENEGGHEVYLFMSFVIEGVYICELEKMCGRDLKMPTLPHRDRGSLQAKEDIARLREFCEELKVSVRPGRYEDQ